jgi:hypothetical protein
MQPVIVEYNIQNEFDSTPFKPGQDPYPNCYILPKKYASIADVRTSEVIKAFPIESCAKWQYVLRFETLVSAGRRNNVKVWMDAPTTNLDCCVPHIDGKVKIKAVRIPKHAQKATVKIPQAPAQRPSQPEVRQKESPLLSPF